MDYPLLSLQLARELEMAEAQAAIDCAERVRAAKGDTEKAVEHVAGGYAVYCGADSPVTQAVGLGLNGPVSDEEFAKLENFYAERKEPVRIETCPLADPSLFAHLGRKCYRVTEFSNVMAQPVRPAGPVREDSGIAIRLAAPDELESWAMVVSRGFAEHYPVTPELLDIMKLFGAGKTTECYFAEIDGKVVGGATIGLRGRVAGLFGASTLPEFRNRGVQTALLRKRLARAAEAGCELAMSIAQPGSASQRNMLRNGFQTLYTRVKFEEREKGA